MRDDQFRVWQDLRENRLLVLRAAAHPKAGGFETDLARIQLRLSAGRSHAFLYRARQLLASFGRAGMIAGPAYSRAQHPSGLIADQRLGVRLPPIHSQKEPHQFGANPARVRINP